MQKHSFYFGTLDPRNDGIMMYFQLLEMMSQRVLVRPVYREFQWHGRIGAQTSDYEATFIYKFQAVVSKSIDGNVASVGIAKKAILMAQKLGKNVP